jgi:hypothetical protein
MLQRATVWGVVAYCVTFTIAVIIDALPGSAPYREFWGEYYRLAVILAPLPAAISWGWLATRLPG